MTVIHRAPVYCKGKVWDLVEPNLLKGEYSCHWAGNFNFPKEPLQYLPCLGPWGCWTSGMWPSRWSSCCGPARWISSHSPTQEVSFHSFDCLFSINGTSFNQLLCLQLYRRSSPAPPVLAASVVPFSEARGSIRQSYGLAAGRESHSHCLQYT